MTWHQLLPSVVVAAIVAGIVSIIGAVITAFVSLRTSERRIQIENVTQERAKWRDKIRKSAGEVCKAWATSNSAKLKELRLTFALLLNPFDDDDRGILSAIDRLSEPGATEACLQEFSDRLSLLLKHDWERAKFEAKPWLRRATRSIAARTPYDELYARGPQPQSNGNDGRAVVAVCGLMVFAAHFAAPPTATGEWGKLLVWGAALLVCGLLWASRK